MNSTDVQHKINFDNIKDKKIDNINTSINTNSINGEEKMNNGLEYNLTNIKINEILKRLPHRYPFILVDRVLEIIPGKEIKAVKNIATNESCFQGHFPEFPVMPGVLLLESMAQASALLFSYSFDLNCFPDYKLPEDGLLLFAGLNNVRFKKVVIPGDQVIIESKFEKMKKDLAKFSARALVDDQVVCQAELLSAYREKDQIQ